MKISELFMNIAKENSIDHFFGIPGSGVPLDLMDSGREIDLHFVNVAHESTAAIAAGAYGLLKESSGLSLAVKGVGAANLTGGIANAYFERMPVVGICETTPNYSYENEMVQHADHYAMMKSVTKKMLTISNDNPGETIRDAFSTSMENRQGPVLIDFPSDMGLVDVKDKLNSPSKPKKSKETNKSEIKKISEIINKSKKPVVIIGNDVKADNAIEESIKFAEKCGAGVISTMKSRGVFPENHERWVAVTTGFPSQNTKAGDLMLSSDLIILIGVDQMMTHTPWPENTLQTIEIISDSHFKTMSSDPIFTEIGNIKSTLNKLTKLIMNPGWKIQELLNISMNLESRFKRPSNAIFATQDIFEISKELLPKEGLVYSETGAFITLLENTWKFDQPSKFFGTSGGRTMGLMIPSFIGGCLATDNSIPSIGIGADGSSLMRMGEFETINRCNLKWPIVIINDAALGTMKYRQGFRKYPDYGLDLTMVDFASAAKSCGLKGITTNTPESFKNALIESFKEDTTTIIDARIDPKIYQDSFGLTLGD